MGTVNDLDHRSFPNELYVMGEALRHNWLLLYILEKSNMAMLLRRRFAPWLLLAIYSNNREHSIPTVSIRQ